MRATQFVRRGLIAFAAVATVSSALISGAAAQSPGAVALPGDDDAIVYNPVPGYVYDVVYTDGARTALLGVSTGGGLYPVAVAFLPDFDGAAIINPGGENLIAERQ